MFSRAAAAAVTLVALTALASWLFERQPVATGGEYVAMNPATAVCFVLCAVAVVIRTPASVGALRSVSIALAVIVLAVALARVCGYLFSFEPGVDRLLFAATLGDNRMAANTAVAFALLATSLLLVDARTRVVSHIRQVCLVLAAAIALFAVTGYVYSALSFTRVGDFIPMAIHTGSSLVLLCLAVWAARPDQEPARTIFSATDAGAIARRLLPAAFLIPLVLGWLWRLQAEAFGRIGATTGVPMVSAAMMTVFAALVWFSARRLLRVEAARNRAEQVARAAATELARQHEALKAAQSQLVQTEKLASLGQLVAGVAHEINNPLAFVGNNLAVLERDAAAIGDVMRLYREGDEAIAGVRPDVAKRIRDISDRIDAEYTISNLRELVGHSREGLRRIQRIVRDLRNFARLDQGDIEAADLNDAIESTINIVRGASKNHHVEIVLALGDLPRVTCNLAKVNQVVMNLLTNAIDACGEGGTVTVRTRVTGANGAAPCVEVEVADTGQGVDPAIADRIFDPFFTTKPPGRGTGLGLSISYGIVRDHGGSIAVDREPGAGARFTVALPVDGAHLG